MTGRGACGALWVLWHFFEMTKIGILMLCSLEASFLKDLLYLWSSIAYFRVHTWSSNLSGFEEHYPVANVNSNATSKQGRRKVWQSSWASSNVVGIICPLPPVWDWVNWFTKYGSLDPLGSDSPELFCDSPSNIFFLDNHFERHL